MRLDTRQLIRRRYLQAVQDAEGQRPSCLLATNLSVDDDGLYWTEFFCCDHGASWRELIGVADEDGSVSVPSVATLKGTPCGVPASESDDVPDGA